MHVIVQSWVIRYSAQKWTKNERAGGCAVIPYNWLLHVVKGGESFKKVIKITKAIGPIGFSIGGFEDMEIRGTYVQGIHIFRIKYWTFCLRTLEASSSKSHWKTSIYYMTHGKDEINFDSRFKTIKPNLFYIESQEVEIVEIHCPWALAHAEKGSRFKKNE